MDSRPWSGIKKGPGEISWIYNPEDALNMFKGELSRHQEDLSWIQNPGVALKSFQGEVSRHQEKLSWIHKPGAALKEFQAELSQYLEELWASQGLQLWNYFEKVLG